MSRTAAPATRTLTVFATPYAYTPDGAPLFLAAGPDAQPPTLPPPVSVPGSAYAPEVKRLRESPSHALPAAYAPLSAPSHLATSWATSSPPRTPASLISHASPRRAPPRRPRLVWTPDLHACFEAAVAELGVESAAPKQIMARMGVPSLTRENVASHLQKYRAGLRRAAATSAPGVHSGMHSAGSSVSTPLGLFSSVAAAAPRVSPVHMGAVPATTSIGQSHLPLPQPLIAAVGEKRDRCESTLSAIPELPVPVPHVQAAPLPPIRLAPLRGAGPAC